MARPSATNRMGSNHLVDREPGTDVRRGPLGGKQLHQLLFVPVILIRRVLREVPELEAQDLDAFEQHQVQGDPRDDP